MTHTLANTSVEFSFVSRIRRLIEGLQARRAQRLELNRAYGELQLLSDRELMEFGLHRSDLYEMARVAVYRV
ncbi:MAG: hypothetical protein ACI9BH_001223 [Paracoccaceae bacterium]|jgi:uncharacterized protein YjiS (DUF1127 family)